VSLLQIRTPTNIQMYRDPYLNGAKDGSSIYDVYYGGFKTMIPWAEGSRVRRHN